MEGYKRNLSIKIFPNGQVSIIYNFCCDLITSKIKDDKSLFNEEELKDIERKNINDSLMRTKKKIFDLSKCAEWDYMLTITFNPELVDSYDLQCVSKKLREWLKRQKIKSPDLQYLVIPEMHKSGRWHFHGFLSNIGDIPIDFYKKDKNGRMVFHLSKFPYGFNTIISINRDELDKCVNYISKYITKELCQVEKGKKRYFHSNNLGEIIEHKVSVGFKYSSPNKLLKLVDNVCNSKNLKVSFCKTGKGYNKTSYFYLVPRKE